MKLSEIKLFNYFKHNRKILQLIDHDYLEPWAVGYENQTDETINMIIYTDVEPVKVNVVEINNC